MGEYKYCIELWIILLPIIIVLMVGHINQQNNDIDKLEFKLEHCNELSEMYNNQIISDKIVVIPTYKVLTGVFYNDTWYLISEKETGIFDYYNWTGSTWQYSWNGTEWQRKTHFGVM